MRGLRRWKVRLGAVLPVAALTAACGEEAPLAPKASEPALTLAPAPGAEAKLTASDGSAGDRFGFSASVDRDVAVIGAPGDDDGGTWSGAAYVFRRRGAAWSQEAKLTAGDAAVFDELAFSVAVDGDVAVAGAPRRRRRFVSGVAYVFRRRGPAWSQEAELTPSARTPRDGFGKSVSVDRDVTIVGAPQEDTDAGTDAGAAYAFRRSGEGWSREARLFAGDAAPDDHFGSSVAVDGDVAVVGAPRDDDAGSGSGSAYVFRHVGRGWLQTAKLLASDGAAFDEFGVSVSVDRNVVVVGARRDDDAGFSSGSAYVFRGAPEIWTEVAKLTANDAAASDFFGWDVSVDGEVVVVGAPADDDAGVNSGTAYLFRGAGGSWTQTAKLTPGDGATGDLFGLATAAHRKHVVAGAFRDDDAGFDSGSAYVFDVTGCPGSGRASHRGLCDHPSGGGRP